MIKNLFLTNQMLLSFKHRAFNKSDALSDNPDSELLLFGKVGRPKSYVCLSEGFFKTSSKQYPPSKKDPGCAVF